MSVSVAVPLNVQTGGDTQEVVIFMAMIPSALVMVKEPV
jgi:hypothetical protein